MYDIDKSLTMLRVYEAFMGVIICGIDFQTVDITFTSISKKKYEKAIEEIRKKKLSPEDEGDDDGYGNLLEKNNGKN